MSNFGSALTAGRGSYVTGEEPRQDYPDDTTCYCDPIYYPTYHVDDVMGGQLMNNAPGYYNYPPMNPGGSNLVWDPGPDPFYQNAIAFDILAGSGDWYTGLPGNGNNRVGISNGVWSGPLDINATWTFDLGEVMWLCYACLWASDNAQEWRIEGSVDGGDWSLLSGPTEFNASPYGSPAHPLLKPHAVRYVRLHLQHYDGRTGLFYWGGSIAAWFSVYRQGLHR